MKLAAQIFLWVGLIVMIGPGLDSKGAAPHVWALISLFLLATGFALQISIR